MRPAGLVIALAAALALAAGAAASPGRVAVGLEQGAFADGVAASAEAATGGVAGHDLEALDALLVSVPDVEAALPVLAGLPGVEYVEPVAPSRSLAFLPNDPLIYFQWYLDSIEAFSYWESRPSLGPVRVAVIDSGIDASHPELLDQILEAKSFVNTKATVDSVGHGTMVAGEIAAAIDNAQGIAGVGFPVELLVAKVVGAAGGISVEAEAKAIRWAVGRGARVINLSLGGRRDPTNTARDTYSALEQAAIEYAYSRGAVIVAATGNCSDVCPYRYASYPAALPHVVGVSALAQDGSIPAFSNRDPVFNDLAAPGAGVVSTFPFALSDPACQYPGYSICARDGVRNGDGTSFAAPLVSATAALLIAQNPTLDPSQVTALLEQTTVDILSTGRDAAAGYGIVNVRQALEALAGPLPPTDRFEANDDAGDGAYTLGGNRRTVVATIDYFDDPSDVYRLYLRAGRRLVATLHGPVAGTPTLVLWRPGTERVTDVTRLALRSGSIIAFSKGQNERVSYTAPRSAWYFVEVKAPKRRGGEYHLSIDKRAH